MRALGGAKSARAASRAAFGMRDPLLPSARARRARRSSAHRRGVPFDPGRGRAGRRARRSSSARPAATCAASGATRRTRRGSPRASGGRSTSWSPPSRRVARHVVVTGGEPLLWSNLPRLTAALRAAGRHVTIETAGTVFQTLECDLMSVSPKLANSDPGPHRAAGGAGGPCGAAPRPGRPHAAARALRVSAQVRRRRAGRSATRSTQLLAVLPPVAPETVLLMPLGTRAAEIAERGRWLAELGSQRRRVHLL